ncbi:uncharacterized protein [Argopecten irradians]
MELEEPAVSTKVRNHYILTKMTLLHALGNAGMNRSLKHITSFMKPNTGLPEWRRAAVNSLKHFSCNESADSLLHSVLHDDNKQVKQEAYEALRSHPNQGRLTVIQRDDILSTNYTYPTLLRLRRGVISYSASLEDGLYFSIVLPGIHWQKVIGNSAIGAEFGITLRNNLELELKYLSGHFEIDIYNVAFAILNLKLVNQRFPLLEAKMCFQGHVGYDMNILKEFGINDISDLANMFDKMSATVIDPVVNAVNAFKDVINFLKDGGIQKVFNTIIYLLKHLPTIFKQVALKFIEHIKTLYKYGGVPWIDHLKRVVIKIRTFIIDVQEDSMVFYQKTIDAVTITLPYIGKKFVESLRKIIAAIMSFFTSPIQSVASVAKSLLDIKMSIGMFMDFKNIMMETLMKISGRSPFWQSYGDELTDIFEEIKGFVSMVTASAHVNSKSKNNDSTQLSDCISSMVEQTLWSKEELKRTVLGAVNETFFSSDYGKDIYEKVKDVIDIYTSLKSSYTTLRSYVQKSIALVQRVFGPKFHRYFPSRRRPKNSKCGQGVWPTTSNNEFENTGVDVMVASNTGLVSPVNGRVFKQSSSRILVLPTDDGLSDFEIVIENVEAISSISADGTFAEAGETIATVLKSRCQPNFIHISVLKVENGKYIDPSRFLDKYMPIPRWILECKDFYFKHIFQTIEIENLGGQLKDSFQTVKRTVSGIIDGLQTDDDASFEVQIETQGMFVEIEQSEGSVLDLLKQALPDFGNVMKLFSLEGITDGLNILKVVDVGGFSLQKVYSMLDSDLQMELDGMIYQLQLAEVDISFQDPSTLSILQLQKLFKDRLQDLYGDWQSTIHEARLRFETDCPNFKGVVGKGTGLACKARADCTGLACAVPLNIGSIRAVVRLDMTVDPCNALLYITDSILTTTVSFDGELHTVTLSDVTVDTPDSEPYVLTLTIQGEEDNGAIYYTIEGALCVKCHTSCLQPFTIINNARVDIPDVCTNINKDTETDQRAEIMQMTWRSFLDALSQISSLDAETVKIADSIRKFVLESLIEKSFSEGYTQALSSIFPDAKDTCSVDEKSLPRLNANFFKIKVPIPVGPIIVEFKFSVGGSLGVSVGIDICVLSMYAKGVVTPSVALRLKGSVSIRILIFTGGISLEGVFMTTKFPITITFKFNKFPIRIDKRLDLEIIPVTLTLRAFLKVDLWLFSKTIFSAVIWRYRSPSIHHTIFNYEDKEPDSDPPVIDSEVTPGVGGCSVTQVKNRSPLNTAFQLEVSASDPVSDVHMFYAIGTTPETTDIMDWTEYSGPSLVVPTTELPNSVPLYWTVKARNSEGLEVFTTCHLDTYDNSIPDGRVDASFAFSSHPYSLSASVTMFEDSPLKTPHYKAVGFSSGGHGNEVIDWEQMTLSSNNPRPNELSDLKYFSIPKPGTLTVSAFSSSKTRTNLLCAKECLKYVRKCVAFDYEYHTENCDLHSVVEGQQAKRRISGTYAHYERLIGSTAYISYTDLPLVHRLTYFINVHVTNVLGYNGFLKSSGTIVDFTTPETGPLGMGYTETVQADRCGAAVTQRCIDVSDILNHRIIRDGENGGTVFNGHVPHIDLLYTLANHYLTVNFDGFHDNETGIWGYTWWAGTAICESDIVKERDPHSHLSHNKYWTHTGYTKDLYLPDGQYYVTVSAINNVVYGGALVTTVCHTTPIDIDTTPPVFQNVTGVYFDESFDILAVYYTAFDKQSDLKLIEFGLGKTKHDVNVRGYAEFPLIVGDDPFVGVEDLDHTPGVYAWIRLRVENNVGLFTSGHGDDPIMIDRTAPLLGIVNDGSTIKSDTEYQYDTTTICANWMDFYDPESGIAKFKWGLGTRGGRDDIVQFRNLTHHEKHICSTGLSLEHNRTYFSTVFAYNSALNQKTVNGSSNGVLIDITPPGAGWVHDGQSEDVQFSSASATKSCNWNNFTDAESNVDHYKASVFVNRELRKTFGLSEHVHVLTDHTVTMEHNDVISWTLTAYNGAGLQISVVTDGFLVDHTAPVMEYLRDSDSDSGYQSNSSKLDISWKVSDPESGISHHLFYIQEMKHGSKSRFWPNHKQHQLLNDSEGLISFTLESLDLKDGAMYSVKVTSTNNAQLSTIHESPGVIIDTTPPEMTQVSIGVAGEDEDVDENGNVIHVENAQLSVYWIGFDSNSGISGYYVGVGTSPGDVSLSSGEIETQETSIVLDNVIMESFDRSQTTYHVTVWAKNGAGLMSNATSSKPIMVVEANVPGTVSDGFHDSIDSDIEDDTHSIGMSFNGFRSAACNIVKYEWAAGSEPYFSDITPFTDFGLVLQNESFGHAQINIQLEENKQFYLTVRATTGHGCHEEFIVSTSDGFRIDSTKPIISVITTPGNDTNYIRYDHNVFTKCAESLLLFWEVYDNSDISTVQWGAGSLPYLDDIHNMSETLRYRLQLGDLSTSSGETIWIHVIAEDAAGNTGHALSPPVTADFTAPSIHNLSCDPTISVNYGVVSCSWDAVEDIQSVLMNLEIAIGTSDNHQDIQAYTQIHVGNMKWTKDIKTEMANIDTNEIFVQFLVSNVLNFIRKYTVKVGVDTTPPGIDTVTIVTTMDATSDEHITQTTCQIPTTYIEVALGDIEDRESSIIKVEVSLGTDFGEEDILPYKDVGTSQYAIFTGLSLEPGSGVYAKARIRNSAGLYTTVISDVVRISQPARLVVHDGQSDGDRDAQKDLNVLDGKWYYSGHCDVQEVEWSILDSTGAILQNHQLLSDTTGTFYNDELVLTNGITYTNAIKITDGLNRTTEKSSDGITVDIQPPAPGIVRDGMAEDINYQFANDQLSGNWNGFGDTTSSDYSQRISHYEAAIGTDVRYTSMRVNVHYFVNTGANTSITFHSLNLTEKSVTYYITVRAYSFSGSYEEAFSNGVKVGYREGIRGGEVSSSSYQHYTDRLSFSWSEFESDIGLKKFYIGIASSAISVVNNSNALEHLFSAANNCDIYPLTDVNTDTFFLAENLTLNHGQSYIPVVVAVDDAGDYKIVTGESVMVDTTPPVTSDATIMINGRQITSFTYIDSYDTVSIEWENISDPESNISSYIVTVYELQGCSGNGDSEIRELLKSMTVSTETKVSFRSMDLVLDQDYSLGIEVVNHAGSSNSVSEINFRVDATEPLEGSVKITNNWLQEQSYQSSKTSIDVLIAIAHTTENYNCPSQVQILPNDENSVEWYDEGDCDNECVFITRTIFRLSIGYNLALSSIDTGVISSDDVTLRKGEYTAVMNVARGENTITSFFFGTSQRAVSVQLEPPEPDDVSSVTFDYDSQVSNTSEATPSSQNETVKDVETTEIISNLEDVDVSGCGVSILGEKQANSRVWDGLFWCVDEYGRNNEWFQLENDPTNRMNSISIRLLNGESGTWNLDLLIEGTQKSVLSGITLPQTAKLFFHTSTNNGFIYPLIWHDPFIALVTITEVSIPTEVDSLCQHGRGFFDGESNIESIQVGISDGLDQVDNISPFRNVQTFCRECISQCFIGCDQNCSFSSNFELLSFQISDLDLLEAVIERNGEDVSIANDTTYYAVAKVTNFAGNEILSYSNGIVVDSTPPVCEELKCVDPTYSSTEETSFIGSNKQLGAFWSCAEDISELNDAVISVISLDDGRYVYPEENIGLKTSIDIELRNGTYFQDRKQYRFNLTIYNTAGLSSSYFCDVTTLLSPPAIDHLHMTSFFTVVTDNTSSVELITQNDRLGISWSNEDDGVKYYEMKVGTEPGKDDIMPLSIIGVNKSSSFYIINDQVWIDGDLAPWNLSDLADPSTVNQNSSDDVPMFLMEPGRCMYIALLARGPSHLTSTTHIRPLCISRSNDATIKSTTQTQMMVHTVHNIMTTVQDDNGALSNMIINITGFYGEAIVGRLSESDLTENYGSAASSAFVSFITDPNTTQAMTSRILTNRMLWFLGQTFVISPTPTYEFFVMDVKIAFNSTIESGTIPMLAVWISNGTDGTGHWDVVDQTCTSESYILSSDGYIIFKVCGNLLTETNQRKKRSTSNTVNTPFQFGAFVINETYSNTAPVLETSVLRMDEDTVLNTVQLFWSDAESDSVMFELSPQHQNDSVNITTDGKLSFTPSLHYADVFRVSVILRENTSLTQSLETIGVLDIEVANVNDPPILLFVHQDGSVSDSRQTHNSTVLFESNLTHYDLGTLAVYDFDDNDTFLVFETTKRDGQPTKETAMTFQESTGSLVELDMLDAEYIKTSLHSRVTVTTYTNLTGKLHVHFRVRDREGAFSHEHVSVAYFLISPCVYGTCEPKHIDGPPCNSTIRSETFEPYRCVCDKGYEGEWCQKEINECETIGCSWMYHCTDKIGAMECTINYGKVLPIAITCIVAFIALTVTTWIFGRKQCSKGSHKIKDDDGNFGSRMNFAFDSTEGALPRSTRPPQSTVFPTLQNQKSRFPYNNEIISFPDMDCRPNQLERFDPRFVGPKEDKKIFRDPTNMGSFDSLRSGPFSVRPAWPETNHSLDSYENDAFDDDEDGMDDGRTQRRILSPISAVYSS